MPKTHANYDKDFRQEAVNLLLSSGRPLKRPDSRRTSENALLLKTMTSIHEHRHTRSYGSRRMTAELRAQGYSASENRVARLMRRSGLQARPRRPYRPKTTCPDQCSSSFTHSAG
jgi:transposase InsO family protein